VAQHVAVVLGILQRPVRRQRLAGGREHGVHHAVAVFVDGGAELGPVPDAHDQGPPGQRAEVDADGAGIRIVSANRHKAAYRKGS